MTDTHMRDPLRLAMVGKTALGKDKGGFTRHTEIRTPVADQNAAPTATDRTFARARFRPALVLGMGA